MERSKLKRNTVTLGAALAIASFAQPFAVPVLHAEQPAPIVALKLNAGNKWPTDMHLRRAMSAIRDEVFAYADPLYLGQMDAARFEGLARKIDVQTAYIIERCAFPPESDAQLHLVLTQIMQGSVAMQGRDPNLSRRAGADRVITALDAYSRYFDHAGWKALVF
jgi:hypothetical protein